jgi:hypothetical protein
MLIWGILEFLKGEKVLVLSGKAVIEERVLSGVCRRSWSSAALGPIGALTPFLLALPHQ